MKVVICGGGIIGCSIAYYLTKLGADDVTVVERFQIAGQASGKAGGFLAETWCDHGPLKKLTHKSYELHMELSKEMKNVGYRHLDTLSVVGGDSLKRSQTDTGSIPEWIDGNFVNSEVIGTQSDTSQVHPKLLTDALLNAAKTKGAKVVMDEVKDIEITENNKITGVILKSGSVLPADVVVIAMGPWSGKARHWFPKAGLLNVTGNRAHSIVMKISDDKVEDVTGTAMFCTYDNKDPEIYPRPDGTVYVCGNSDNEPLPENPADVQPGENKCEDLFKLAGKMSSVLKNSTIAANQACYLPFTSNGLPMIGKIPKYEGAFIASGHTCWGILNAPATGWTMANLIMGKSEENGDMIKPFDPEKM